MTTSRVIHSFILAAAIGISAVPAHAKVFDLASLLSGDVEAGDVMEGPVKIDVPKAAPVDTRPIKMSSMRADVAPTTTVAPISNVTATSSTKKKDAEEDESDAIGVKLSGISLTGAFTFPSFGTSTSVAYSSDISVVRSSITNPSQAMSYMQNYFSYEQHGSDTPYSPEKFNAYGKGDCKDFSTFLSWAVADDGYEATIRVIKTGPTAGTGHVISIYNDVDGLWYVQSNQNSYGPINSADEGMKLAVSYNLPSGTTIDGYRDYPTGYVGQLAYE